MVPDQRGSLQSLTSQLMGLPGSRSRSRRRSPTRSVQGQSSPSPSRAPLEAQPPIPLETSTPVQGPGSVAPGASSGDQTEEEPPTEPPPQAPPSAGPPAAPLGFTEQQLRLVEAEQIQTAVAKIPLDYGFLATILRVQFGVDFFHQPDPYPCLNTDLTRFSIASRPWDDPPNTAFTTAACALWWRMREQGEGPIPGPAGAVVTALTEEIMGHSAILVISSSGVPYSPETSPKMESWFVSWKRFCGICCFAA